MANLIRLKQIESGSYLNTAATIGQDFSQSVVDIITSEVTAVLPDGIISSSVQVDLLQTTNFVGFSSSISNSITDINDNITIFSSSVSNSIAQTNSNIAGLSSSVSTSFANVYVQLASITGSLETGLSASVATSFSQSNSIFNIFSASVHNQISASSANTIDISSSVNARLVNLESFSSSLDNGFATDAELTTTASQIIDQGEW